MAQHLMKAYERGYATGRRLAEKVTWQGTLSSSLLKDSSYRTGQDCHIAYKKGFIQALEDAANVAAMSWCARKGSAKNRERRACPEGTRSSGADTRHHNKFLPQPSGSLEARKRGAEVILEYVFRLINQHDNKELTEGQDLSFLELAKTAFLLRPLRSRLRDAPG